MIVLAADGTAWDSFSRGKRPVTDIGMAEKKKAAHGRRTPLGDRRQFLTMMSPDVIKAIKQAALEEDRAAWDVMEEAAKQWLERRRMSRRG
jgi:hypothetical protein